jgi:hypothetical protein
VREPVAQASSGIIYNYPLKKLLVCLLLKRVYRELTVKRMLYKNSLLFGYFDEGECELMSLFIFQGFRKLSKEIKTYPTRLRKKSISVIRESIT